MVTITEKALQKIGKLEEQRAPGTGDPRRS